MTLRIPKYIQDAAIQDALIRYTWDDWNVQSIYKVENDEFHKRMLGLSHRANFAFAVACGEWSAHRFDLVSDDQTPHQQLEAFWAGIIDPGYVIWSEHPDEYWPGPIRGALQLAIIFTLEAMDAAFGYKDPAQSAANAWHLAKHIMTDDKPFMHWKEHVVDRLELLYPLDETDPLGDVVPREAMDPDFDFRPEMTEKLVQAYLDRLTPGLNPVLRTPEQMIESGFKGTPYVFNMEEDRIARNDY